MHIHINSTYLTAAELLPPRSQLDSCILTGSRVCVVTGTTQLLAATLGTQIKQAVAEMYANIFRF